MKYIRNDTAPIADMPESQSKISDELAAVWIKNGNTNIRDLPWPNLPFVQAYFVTEGPAPQ